MIPVKLTIQGLYSYQEKQTIDFPRLTEANLFGIFGTVGSGKSSILEAITFAIYGETDRLNSRDSRNYNMMNLKSNDLLIEFIFETGKDQTAYQAVVKGKRNGKKFEEVKTLERTAYRQENGRWIPIEPESLGKAIGLSYDNFKRTIIIPQGQFQEFLQLGKLERTQMMKELFNLGRFELSSRVTSLENKNNAQKQNIEGQLQQLGEVDPEQVNQYTVRLAELKLEIERLSKQSSENQKKESEFRLLQDLVRKKEDNQKKLNALNEKLPEIQLLEQKIADYEYCLIHFKNLFDAADSGTKKVQQLNEKMGIEMLNLKNAEDQIAASEQSYAAIKVAYDCRDMLKQQAEELDKLIRLAELKQLIIHSEDRIKKGDVFIQNANSSIEKLKLEKKRIELQLKEEKAKQPDMVALSNAKSWHDVNKNLLQQVVAGNGEIEKFKKELAAVDQSIAKQFEEVVLYDFSGDFNKEAGIRFLAERIEQMKAQNAELDSEIQHFRVQLKLEEYAVNLKGDEACPLCGSLHHPGIFSAGNVSGALTKALNRKSEFEKQIAACELQISRFNELDSRRKLNEQYMCGLLVRQKELEEKVVIHENQFRWENYRKEETVVTAFAVSESLRKGIHLLEKQLDELSKRIDQETVNKEKYLQEIEKIKTELTVAQTERNTLTGQINLLDATLYDGKTKDGIAAEKKAVMQKLLDIERQYTQLNNQLVELRKNKDILSGSIAANQLQLAQEKNNLAEIQVRIEKELKDSAFQLDEAVKEILKLGINPVAEKQKVSAFKQDISLTRNQLDLLIREIGDRQYDAMTHENLHLEIEKDTELINLRNKEYGIVEKSLQDLRKALESQASLRKNLENIELRAENIKTMKSLFKASGFVNYISSVYLQNLCNAANDRFFQLTRQKLSLEITEDNSFQVRDFLNGGKVRSVKTLSGGQTFQAALSLALALADNIQKITDSNQNFFFLDEGFGSLDKDSLAVVFDTLKSLRKENRIVGVISHVEEMQQEIDTHLRIVNQEEAGSRIFASWE
ncbi:MAG: SbcC/MukB-like Walker B domain-containing protein [Bacteroidota bacterium]|nr:SbcC/MukB-like Walker B domain-containing protein [Bacteroidota bacterium]